VSSGAATLAEQASSLSALPAATQQLAAGAGQVSDGAAQLSAAVAASGISDSTSQAVAALTAAEQYIQAGDTTTAMAYLSAVKDQLSASGATVSALASSIDTLSAGAAQVSAGATQLSESVSEEKITALTNGISALSSGATQVSEGVTSASSGAKTLASGTPALTSGASSAQDGAGDIASGAQQLADGSTELGDGLIEAQDGTQELNDGLTDAVDSLAMTQAQIDAKAEQMSQPVELDESYLTSVKNYGTGFAPFFLGLAMWVGAIFAGFVFHPLNPRLSLSRANPVMTAFSGYLPMGAFAIVQALIALAFVQFALHVQINNVAAYYAIGLLTSVVFMAIMQFLVGAFGFPGRFVAVVLLTLQLTSASGTFPVSTAPAFFQALAPFMPLTYVVEAMREVMTGLDFTLALTDCGIIAIYGIVAFALTCLVAWRKRVVTVQTLHPLLEL
jgi:putative membrane protein